ncbi:hypothetical protein DFS33DRAFT_1297323 [Desarmillaria ectypa]|nr:hypothetical protein DFS33DRAFT_1297323 [Desarmillaria ectypa]
MNAWQFIFEIASTPSLMKALTPTAMLLMSSPRPVLSRFACSSTCSSAIVPVATLSVTSSLLWWPILPKILLTCPPLHYSNSGTTSPPKVSLVTGTCVVAPV